jgi:2-succinyl-5-enolpyruvyl-6-hydroxy-3-cyclohexene-1-carboxylate synthase
VHLNLPFREPLVGDVGEVPEPIGPPLPVPRSWATQGPVPPELDHQRGVIVVGGRHGVDVAAIGAFAERTGWPVLADPLSGCRSLPQAVSAVDALLRHEGFAADHAPQLVVRFGRPPASKVLGQWIVRCGAPVIQVGGPGVIDPDHNVIRSATLDELASITGASGTTWLARWRRADERAEAAISAAIAAGGDTLTEPAVARAVAGWLPGDAELVVSSSMPVRDLEWFGGRAARAHSNRGANGIDGVVSTALGRALAGRTTAVLIGDIAFVHDSNALAALPTRGADLRIVVVDNGGGGIFSFLPQATALAPDRFEQLFGTPHGTDVEALARAHGVTARAVTTEAELHEALGARGPSVVRVVTERAANVAEHARLNAAVAAALG